MNSSPLYGMLRICRYAMLVAATAGVLSAASPQTAFAATKTFTCHPSDVGVFPQKRIHVRCAPADGAIEWFALGIADAGDANRILSLVSTAYALKKSLTIWYDPADLSGGAIGCLTKDCRLIQGARMF